MQKLSNKELSNVIFRFELGNQVTLDGLHFSKNINRNSFDKQIKLHLRENQMTAMELCGIQGDCLLFKVGNSNIEWESISYRYNCDKLRIQRLCEAKEGGSCAFLGMNLKEQYITPETIVTVIRNIN